MFQNDGGFLKPPPGYNSGGGVGPAGPRGPQGPQGPQGPSGSGDARHDQLVASDTWNISHGLNRFPGIAIVDSAGDEVEGKVAYIDANNVQITFSAAFAGTAYLN